MAYNKSKARKLAEFLRNITDDAKIETSAVEQDTVVTSRADLESKATDTESLVTPAAVTSYVSNKLDDYVHSTHDINLTFTGDVTGHGTITDMGHTSFALTLDAETLPVQTGYAGKFLTTDGTTASWATVDTSNGDTAYSWGDHAQEGYLTSFTETDPTVPSHVKGITPTDISQWDTAYSWGDHSQEGYLTSETNDYVDSVSFSTSTGILRLGRTGSLSDLTVDLDGRYLQSYTDTTYNVSAVDVSGGKAVRLTGSDGTTDDVKFAAGSNVSLARSGDTITISSTDTNTDTNTTDWYVANSSGGNQFKVDKNENVRFEGTGATSVSFNASNNKITISSTDTNTETTTNLVDNGDNTITYTNEEGTAQTIDLSLYLDDTNLARILSGTMNSSGVATFTRDDSTTFTVDMSVLLDDTNLSRITSASWNTSNGVLTLNRNDSSTVTVDLDGRYYNTTDSNNRYVLKTGDTMTGDLNFSAQANRAIKIDTTVADNETRDAIELFENDGQATGRQAISWWNDDRDYYKARLWTEVGGSYNATKFGIDVADNARAVATRLFIQDGNTYVTGSFLGSKSIRIGAGGSYQAGSIYSDGNWGMIFRGAQSSPNNAEFRWANSADTELMRIDNSGNLDLESGGYRINGTTVIDSSRNLTNVPTATLTSGLPLKFLGAGSGTYTMGTVYCNSGGLNIEAPLETDSSAGVHRPITLTWRGGYSAQGGVQIRDYITEVHRQLKVRTDNQAGYIQAAVRLETVSNYRGAGVFLDNTADNEVWYAGTPYTDHNGYYMIGYQSGGGTDEQAQLTHYKLRVDNAGNVSAKNSLQINGTTVIDSSRNAYFNSITGSIDYSNITNPPTIDNSVDYINGASFNTSTGVLTLSGVGRAGASVDLDGRYAASSHVHNYMPIRNSTPYTVMSNTSWGDFNLGNGTMLQSSSAGLPSGGTHGYWFVTGKRDVQEGYVGLYFNHYSAASGMWIGKNTDGNAAPNWERVYTDSYHPISWNELSDKPTIPDGNLYVRKSGDTMTGPLVINGNASYVGNSGYNTLVLQDVSNYPGINFSHSNGSIDWLHRMNGADNSIQWFFRNGGNHTERMSLTSGGRLTLKGGTQQETLVVEGDYPQITIRKGSVPDASIHYDSGYAKKWNVGPGAGHAEEAEFGFAVYSGPRGTHYTTPLRINADTGYVQVGDRDNPTERLDVDGNALIRGNLTVQGNISQSDGFGTLYTFNTTQALSTSWADVSAIAGSVLPTGTYAIQIKVDNHDASGGNYSEHYSGTMAWYGSNTNDGDSNEIPLHNAGHAYNGAAIYARTLRRPSGQGGMILQLAASGSISSDAIEIKIRKLI